MCFEGIAGVPRRPVPWHLIATFAPIKETHTTDAGTKLKPSWFKELEEAKIVVLEEAKIVVQCTLLDMHMLT